MPSTAEVEQSRRTPVTADPRQVEPYQPPSVARQTRTSSGISSGGRMRPRATTESSTVGTRVAPFLGDLATGAHGAPPVVLGGWLPVRRWGRRVEHQGPYAPDGCGSMAVAAWAQVMVGLEAGCAVAPAAGPADSAPGDPGGGADPGIPDGPPHRRLAVERIPGLRWPRGCRWRRSPSRRGPGRGAGGAGPAASARTGRSPVHGRSSGHRGTASSHAGQELRPGPRRWSWTAKPVGVVNVAWSGWLTVMIPAVALTASPESIGTGRPDPYHAVEVDAAEDPAVAELNCNGPAGIPAGDAASTAMPIGSPRSGPRRCRRRRRADGR